MLGCAQPCWSAQGCARPRKSILGSPQPSSTTSKAPPARPSPAQPGQFGWWTARTGKQAASKECWSATLTPSRPIIKTNGERSRPSRPSLGRTRGGRVGRRQLTSRPAKGLGQARRPQRAALRAARTGSDYCGSRARRSRRAATERQLAPARLRGRGLEASDQHLQRASSGRRYLRSPTVPTAPPAPPRLVRVYTACRAYIQRPKAHPPQALPSRGPTSAGGLEGFARLRGPGPARLSPAPAVIARPGGYKVACLGVMSTAEAGLNYGLECSSLGKVCNFS